MPVIIGPFVVGLFTGLVASYSLDEMMDYQNPSDGPPPPQPYRADQNTINQVAKTFLPATAKAIEVVVHQDPEAKKSWKTMMAYLPGLTEAVAMFFVMMDPNVALAPRLTIAGSLLYFISPVDLIPDNIPLLGQLDDLGVLLTAFKYVAGHIDQQHIAQAVLWLRSQGIEPTPAFYLGKDPGQVKALPMKDSQPPAAPPKFGGY